jgi:predicted transcriptional regulator
MSKFLFISVKPEFANKLINKTKTIELRKNKPNVNIGDFVIIYATVPIASIIGFGRIKRIIENSPDFIWDNFSEELGIDKIRYDDYFKLTNRAIGIEINSICKLPFAIKLIDLRKFMPKFSPPQSYRYLTNFKALRTYKLIEEAK